MHLRKTRKLNRIESCDVPPVAPQKLRQYVAALAVARGPRWTSVTARDNPELRKRWRAREVFIGINIDVRRMVNGSQPHVIEIDQFLHDLGKPEAQAAVAGLHMAALDAQILRGIGNIRFAGRNPVTDDSRPDHVGDKLVVFAVPHPHHRARTAASVDLTNDVAAAGRKLNFILHDARWPQEP